MKIAKIQLLNNLDHLQAGDVILFRSVYHKSIPQKLIGYYQSLTTNIHGHYETVHAGICVGHDTKGPVIAHVTGGKYFGYVKESLIDSNIGDQESRSLLVYRHHDQEIRELIATRAEAIEREAKKPQWSFAAAAKLLFSSSTATKSPQEISISSVCSKFVTEILQQATKNHASYLAVNSTVSPKALEASLYNNKHYDLLLYTGNPVPTSKQGIDPYLALKKTVETELSRLEAQKNNSAIFAKYTKIKAALLRSEELTDKKVDSLEKAQHLLNEVMPVLQINTGLGFRKATSYQNVAEQARKLGIFRWQENSVKATVRENHLATVRSTYGMQR